MEKSLVKALRLIEGLARSETPRGVSDLARELGLNKSNVHRILDTLREHNYVVQHEATGLYQLNLKLFELGSRLLTRLHLKEIAQPWLSRVMEQTGESCHLMLYQDGEVIYLDKIENRLPVRAVTEIGARAPAACVASGKVLLAYRPQEEVNRVLRNLKRYTSRTITDAAALQREIDAARRVGYAINREGWREGVCGAAAPILIGHDSAIAAIAILGPARRLTLKRLQECGAIVVAAARAVSKELGYDPAPPKPVPASAPGPSTARGKARRAT
jgi:IclR family KDG regulon transcriptional repressor